ncbi:MAG: hypothetical protein CVU87_09530 [Firmicutes bacterium HGW-Firmicutes-12]|jgi:hypothetical protein|nr:MAG: hypothetical protein CVU87_09530 [Firmicutes bacterium HGW-Firmicutes-12]
MWYASSELDISEMAKLAETHYGKAEISNEEYLQWEYSKNPHGNVIGNVARNSAGELVAQYLIMPKDVWYNGRVYKGSHSLNTLTHPDYNGQGIFTSLARKTYQDGIKQGVIFTYATPNPNSYYGFSKKLEFVSLGNLDFFIKPVKLFSFFHSKFRSRTLAETLATLCSPVKFLFRQRIRVNNTIEVREISSFDFDYETFWNRYKNNHVIIGDRSSKLMNWRYFQSKQREYRVFMAYQDKLVVGCVVIRITTIKGLRVGLVIDLMIDRTKEGQEASYQLLKIVEKIFEQEEVLLAGCLLKKNTNEAIALKMMGYRKCPRYFLPQPFPVLVKIHAEQFQNNLKELYNWDNWFFTLGDYDIC